MRNNERRKYYYNKYLHYKFYYKPNYTHIFISRRRSNRQKSETDRAEKRSGLLPLLLTLLFFLRVQKLLPRPKPVELIRRFTILAK